MSLSLAFLMPKRVKIRKGKGTSPRTKRIMGKSLKKEVQKSHVMTMEGDMEVVEDGQ